MANLQVKSCKYSRRGAKTPNQPAVIALVSDEQGIPTKATRCWIMSRGKKKNHKHLRIAKATSVAAEAIKASGDPSIPVYSYRHSVVNRHVNATFAKGKAPGALGHTAYRLGQDFLRRYIEQMDRERQPAKAE